MTKELPSSKSGFGSIVSSKSSGAVGMTTNTTSPETPREESPFASAAREIIQPALTQLVDGCPSGVTPEVRFTARGVHGMFQLGTSNTGVQGFHEAAWLNGMLISAENVAMLLPPPQGINLPTPGSEARMTGYIQYSREVVDEFLTRLRDLISEYAATEVARLNLRSGLVTDLRALRSCEDCAEFARQVSSSLRHSPLFLLIARAGAIDQERCREFPTIDNAEASRSGAMARTKAEWTAYTLDDKPVPALAGALTNRSYFIPDVAAI